MMKVNEPIHSSPGGSAAAARARQSGYTEPVYELQAPVCAASLATPRAGLDPDLAELVRSLRSLAAESPERQAKIEGLMSAYARGDLHVDAEATAAAIIDDAVMPVFR